VFSIEAKSGVNAVLVTYTDVVAEQYPEHVKHATLFGRLLTAGVIVNVDVSLTHDAKVCVFVLVCFPCGRLSPRCTGEWVARTGRMHTRTSCSPCWCLQLRGYVATFDVRDAGVYTLQVSVGWYFGDVEIGSKQLPRLVGTHVGYSFNRCSSLRALVGTDAVAVTAAVAPASLSVFGTTKCSSADHPGRWIDMASKGECSPPFCTGLHMEAVHGYDWVRCCRGAVTLDRG
jgi:uncharacterized Zn-finger protein